MWSDSSRRICQILLVLVSAACSAPKHDKAAGEQVLSQASGVELGMNWNELTAVRPRVIRDSHMVWEAVGDTAANIYFFGMEDDALQPGTTRGTLRAIVMEQSLPPKDSVRYRAHLEQISSHWEITAGTHFRADSTGVGRFAVRAWCLRSFTLQLLYQPGAAPSGPHRILRAVVRYPDAEIPGTGVTASMAQCPA